MRNRDEQTTDRAVLQHSVGTSPRGARGRPPPAKRGGLRVAGSSENNVNVLAAPDERSGGDIGYRLTDRVRFKHLAKMTSVPAWQRNNGCYWAANELCPELPAGLYRAIDRPNFGICLKEIDIDTDELMVLPDSPSQTVIAEIKEFWRLKQDFEARGFIHKRGVMLWGPPGSGKTATVNQIIALIVREHGGIGFFVDHALTAQHCLQMVRQIEPERPIVALLEDFDALVGADRDAENAYLSLLDGEGQVSNIVFVATSNYPERLDRRFTDRPSRFDLIRHIGMPSSASRRMYLATKEPSLSERELNTWVERTDGLSIAHLRELIILCRCYHKSLDEALTRLFSMREQLPSSSRADDGIKATVGFSL